MHGWRGRLALLMPADNTVVGVEMAARLPDGVMSNEVRLSTGHRRDQMVAEAAKVAQRARDADADVLAYTASSLLLGPDGDRRLSEEISRACDGLPTFTAAAASSAAIRALGARRLAILSPHPEAIAAHQRSYLESDGFEVSSLVALGLDPRATNRTRPETVDRAARRLDVSGADAVLVAATNLRTFEVIDGLESALGLPVITSNQACLWAGLRRLGVGDHLEGLGRLLREA